MSVRHPPFSFREISPLFFAIFIDILGFGLVYPVLTALFTGHTSLTSGISQEMRYLYLSLGFLLYPLFMFFGSSFMGDLSDILGRKKVLLSCMGGLFIGFFLMGVGVSSGSLLLLFAGRAFSGLMSASMPIALAAISDLSTKANKAVHMSYVGLAQSVGFVLGPFLGGVLSDSTLSGFFNFAFPFFTASVLALIAAFWIWKSFKETFVKKTAKQIQFSRLFSVFVEASRHRAIRLLALIFLFMQMGIALYLQLILIFFKKSFDYSSLKMGLFNAFLGLWFAVGLLVVIPYFAKRYRIETLVVVWLFITGLSELLSSLVPSEYLLWILGIPLAISVQVAYTFMLTSISNAADANVQGWAMGIAGSIVAISFVITGLSPTLVPILGVKVIIFFGSLFMFAAFALMWHYCKKILPLQKSS